MPEDFKKKPIIEKYLEKFKDIRENIQGRINVSSALNFFHKYGSLIMQFRNVDKKSFMKKFGATARALVKQKIKQKINVYKSKFKNKIKSKIRNFTSKVKSKIQKTVKNTVKQVKTAVKEKIGEIPQFSAKNTIGSISNGMKKFQNMKYQIHTDLKVISNIKNAVEDKKKLIKKKKVNVSNVVQEKEYNKNIKMESFLDDTTIANSENAHSNTQENDSLRNKENKGDSVVAVDSQNQIKKVEKKEQETKVDQEDGLNYKEIL
jgi:hypothetical protein